MIGVGKGYCQRETKNRHRFTEGNTTLLEVAGSLRIALLKVDHELLFLAPQRQQIKISAVPVNGQQRDVLKFRFLLR